jgi:hypothetical protein
MKEEINLPATKMKIKMEPNILLKNQTILKTFLLKKRMRLIMKKTKLKRTAKGN